LLQLPASATIVKDRYAFHGPNSRDFSQRSRKFHHVATKTSAAEPTLRATENFSTGMPARLFHRASRDRMAHVIETMRAQNL
jgi:hypothetical protein